ncbi:hypothetical protein QO004_001046 [Rhizobium mesoamericanum]|uniref:hypothetical protein n=1 Tax=Rhizobium mesoamericanum TaxID=1079800 RepID=UPI0027845353|nr:hypothetical protein [Rhizobium mesoamericanum]MDQ0559268.1 hypothetical protein [Rhizobium mesoamericanum]
MSLIVAFRQESVEYFKESLGHGASECVSARRDSLPVHIERRNREVSAVLGDDCPRPASASGSLKVGAPTADMSAGSPFSS